MYGPHWGTHSGGACRRLKLPHTTDEVDSYTDLGVTIDNKLLFDKFLKEKCNKIFLGLHQLGKMHKYITSNIANILYKQTIIPLFVNADFLIKSGQNIYIG